MNVLRSFPEKADNFLDSEEAALRYWLGPKPKGMMIKEQEIEIPLCDLPALVLGL